MIKFIAENIMHKKRYLAIYITFFIISVFIALLNPKILRELKNYCSVICVLTALMAVIFLFRHSKRSRLTKRIGFFMLAVSVFCLGFVYAAAYNFLHIDNIRDFEGGNSLIFGTVSSEPKPTAGGKHIGCQIDVSYIESDGRQLRDTGRIMLYLPFSDNCEVKFGDGITFTAAPQLPSDDIDGFNFNKALLSRGCTLMCNAKEYQIYEADKNPVQRLMYLGHILRVKISEYAEHSFQSGDMRELFKGILTGIKLDMPDDLYNNLTASGLIHIAAVSGLHIGFLFLILESIPGIIPLRIREIAIILTFIIYADIAMFTPSVCRAIITISLFLLSKLIYRTADAPTSLFCAAAILVLYNPYIIYSTSFMLSFAASLSLLIYIKPFSGLNKILSDKTVGLFTRHIKNRAHIPIYKNKLHKFLDMFAVPAACQILVIPLSVCYFGGIGFGTILGNIIVIPCTMIVFSAGIINFVIYLIMPTVSKVISSLIIYLPLKIICYLAAKLSCFYINIEPNVSMPVHISYLLLSALLYYILSLSCKKRQRI